MTQGGKLEDLVAGAVVRGIDPAGPITVVTAEWHGTQAVTLVYETGQPKCANRWCSAATRAPSSSPNARPCLELRRRRARSSASLSEARRIRLAYLFDPMLAVHTPVSRAAAAPDHGGLRRDAPRQPLRFLLADDPGAGKTIMAGLSSRS